MNSLELLEKALKADQDAAIPEGYKTVTQFSDEWGRSRSCTRDRLLKGIRKKFVDTKVIGRHTYYKLLIKK